MKNSDPVPKLRTRKSVQESGTSGRGRVSGHVQKTRDHHLDVSRNHSSEMSKSSSISNINQVRPRSTSLTRSQSQRLGPRGHVTTSERHVGQPRVNSATVRPRSSTLNSNPSTARGNFSSESFSYTGCPRRKCPFVCKKVSLMLNGNFSEAPGIRRVARLGNKIHSLH